MFDSRGAQCGPHRRLTKRRHGIKGGTHEIFFAQYKKILAAHWIELEYRTTGGGRRQSTIVGRSRKRGPAVSSQGGAANRQS
jgi:hypothetical protein